MRHRPLPILLLPLLVAAWGCGGGGQGGEHAGGAAPQAPAAEQHPSPASATPQRGSAVIAGTVTYEGEVPHFKAINMGADPACQAKHDQPVYPPVLVLGDGNTLANVFVRVTSGLPAGSWPAPSEPAVIDQRGCEYHPHVIGVMAGQPLRFLNSDGVLHNVHAMPHHNPEFNLGMPPERHEASKSLETPEEPFHVRCDVHPWMSSWVAVVSNPFFATTGADGAFRIEGLPAGTYQLEAWHEKLGTKTASVTVADGETGSVSFTFSPPS